MNWTEIRRACASCVCRNSVWFKSVSLNTLLRKTYNCCWADLGKPQTRMHSLY